MDLLPIPPVRTCDPNVPAPQYLTCTAEARKENEQAWTARSAQEAQQKSAWEAEVAALEAKYDEEVRAHKASEAEYRQAWDTRMPTVKTRPVHLEYAFFSRERVVVSPPCAGDNRGRCLVRPHQLYTGAHTWIRGIHWASWGQRSALGYGTLVERSIYASFTRPARVRLSLSAECEGQAWFWHTTIKSGRGFSNTYLHHSNLTPCY